MLTVQLKFETGAAGGGGTGVGVTGGGVLGVVLFVWLLVWFKGAGGTGLGGIGVGGEGGFGVVLFTNTDPVALRTSESFVTWLD